VTLRTRLVLTLVGLAALGLIVLGGVTYASQRSYQMDRIDQQTQAAGPALSFQLDRQGSVEPGAPVGGDGHDDGRRGGGPDPRDAYLPPGTYGERRDAGGRRIGTPVYSSYVGESLPAAPVIPANLEPGTLTDVPAASGSLEYRVRVMPTRGGRGTTIVAIPLNGVEDALRSLLLVEALVVAAVLLALGGLAWVLVRAGLRPLERMGDTAGAIVAGDLGRRVEVDAPRTEVGRLGAALNGMLGRLEQAFAEREASEGRLRQFLSDASHELRTPLASIRGYAELFRMGALGSEEEAAGAMRRIEDEAARMGVLVEDLLVLARLDEVRAPVRSEVDLAELAANAAADARAMAPEREVTLAAGEDATVVGDPDQLRQVLANLVRNALVHTPPGTPIEITASADASTVRVEVADHGPGLPSGDPARLFDRFWRSEAGRGRGRAGAGLGLAIVAAIAAAHHGTVTAANAPSGGATFVLTLPRAGAARAAPSSDSRGAAAPRARA
jgi:two-component system, OmpR family, sensor kinase